MHCRANFLLLCIVMFFMHNTHVSALERKVQSNNDDVIEHVLVHLRNITNGSKSLPGSNGLVKLERRSVEKEAQTLDAMASFYDVPAKKGYTITGWHKSSSSAFKQPLELWGIWEDIEIAQEHKEFIFTRKMPYVHNVSFSFIRDNIANPSLQVNEEIITSVFLNNPSSVDYKSEVTLMLKNVKTGSVYSFVEDITLHKYQGKQKLQINFTVPEAGEYIYATGVYVNQRINSWTDCWDWSKEPGFFVTEGHRTIQFAGYQWDVKAGFGNPGNNFWSNDSTDIWVDEFGKLNLTLTPKNAERWYGTELISKDTFGYGTYTFYLDADPSLFDPHVVAGIFLYKDELNEIDIEFSRWGDDENYQFGNYVIQPAENPGNQFRFPVITSGSYTTHQIIWMPDMVYFSSWHGHYSQPREDNIIAQWQYTGEHVPKQEGLRLFFNLWLFRGIAPKTTKREKITINNFTFEPAAIDASINDQDGAFEQSTVE